MHSCFFSFWGFLDFNGVCVKVLSGCFWKFLYLVNCLKGVCSLILLL